MGFQLHIFAIFCVKDDKRLNKKFLDVGYAGQNLMLQSERLKIQTHQWVDGVKKK